MNRGLWLALAMVCLAGLVLAAPAKQQKGGKAALPGQEAFVKKALAESVVPKRKPNPEMVQRVQTAKNYNLIPPQYRALIDANTASYVTLEEFSQKSDHLNSMIQTQFHDPTILLLYAGKSFAILLMNNREIEMMPLSFEPEMLLAVFEPVKKPTRCFKLSPAQMKALTPEEQTYAKLLLEVLNENFSYIHDIPFFMPEKARFQRNEYAWRVPAIKALLMDATVAQSTRSSQASQKVPEALLHPQKGELQRRFGVPVYDWNAVIEAFGGAQPIERGAIYTQPDYYPLTGIYCRIIQPAEAGRSEDFHRDMWQTMQFGSVVIALQRLTKALNNEADFLKTQDQWTANKQRVIDECIKCLERTNLLETALKLNFELDDNPWGGYYSLANPKGKPKKTIVRSCVGVPPSTEGNMLKRSPQPVYKKP